MSIDEAKNEFDIIVNNVELINSIKTESDTRFKLIDEILTKVLEWNKELILTEPHIEGGYIDYLMKYNGRNYLIIEAKKIENDLWNLCDKTYNVFNINGPALKKAFSAIEQARQYAVSKSVSSTILTNGNTWIGFLGCRADGIEWENGKSIVFPSLDSISNNFEKFYQFFSKDGIIREYMKVKIREAELGKGEISAQVLKLPSTKYPILLPKNKLSSDIEKIFNTFFDKITDEKDKDMLEKCFVESKESKYADSTLKAISENLISSITTISSKNSSSELEEAIEETITTKEGRTVLIVGNKGSGKTTFINRFFNIVLDPKLKKKCLILNIDVGVFPGVNLSEWLTNRLIESIHNQLYEDGQPSYNDLKGIYYKEYKHYKDGLFLDLYNNNRPAFNIKFGEFLENAENNKFEYLIKLLTNIVYSRKIMPCIIFDNLDHHQQEIQDSTFQYAQSIRDKILSFTLCPITDKTIWMHYKSGAMQSFITTVLYLPAPPTKEIIRNRIDYMKGKLSSIKLLSTKNNEQNYFLKRGINLSIGNLDKFIANIQETFINTDNTSKIIGRLTNYSVRRTLLLSKEIMISPVISSDDLFISNFSKQSPIPLYKIEKAIILGNYNLFNQESNNYILNLFMTNSDNYTSPLLKLRILSYIKDKYIRLKNNQEDIFFEIEDIYNTFYSTQISETAVKQVLHEFLQYGLISSQNPNIADINKVQKVCLLPSGNEHYYLALKSKTYLFNMAIRTPILENEYYYKLQDYLQKDQYAKYYFDEIISCFIAYCIQEDNKRFIVPNSSTFEHQNILTKALKKYISAE
ncbi:MAG: hypothetical protein VZR09_10020 [Candidatus Gastranaerophilaceae bacterium]|nr:hypothetical protein [Candidatus Gastranaerophilaceae bacterium]